MNDKRYYIAYGSNLSVEHMAVRCPDAKPVGKAILHDWGLKFKLHADIEPREGETVPVLVWEISAEDEKHLDFYEGYPSYYIKKELPITMTDFEGKNPEDITAMVYVMTEGHALRMPTREYYMILWYGYERFGFETEGLKRALEESEEAQHEFSKQ